MRLCRPAAVLPRVRRPTLRRASPRPPPRPSPRSRAAGRASHNELVTRGRRDTVYCGRSGQQFQRAPTPRASHATFNSRPERPSVLNGIAGFTGTQRLFWEMAERVGFEPTVRLPAQRFSRPSQSTTLAPLRKARAASIEALPYTGTAGRHKRGNRPAGQSLRSIAPA